MVGTLFRTDDITVEGAAAKLIDLLPFQVFLAGMPPGATDYPCSVGNDSADNGRCPLFDNEMVAVKEGDDRIWCLLDADDVVGVDVHHLFIHPGQENHGFTKITEISL